MACLKVNAFSPRQIAGNGLLRTWTRTLAVCSPEGIRTPDLFLERDEVERSGPARVARTNRYWDPAEAHGR